MAAFEDNFSTCVLGWGQKVERSKGGDMVGSKGGVYLEEE